jgi:undecaprenyl pyrophosphate phosphatase UppP
MLDLTKPLYCRIEAYYLNYYLARGLLPKLLPLLPALPQVILASDSDDVLFMSQFLDTQWVVYADLAVRGAALWSEPVKIRETSVRKMHSVTVRSWLETGQVACRACLLPGHSRDAALLEPCWP